MYGKFMHRTTLYLPDPLQKELSLAMQASKRSMASIIREAVELFLERRRKGKGRKLNPLQPKT